MNKKFKNYLIKTTYSDDTTTYSGSILIYKEALEYYNKIKEDNANETCHIEFFGVFPNGEFQLLFDKIVDIPEESQENIYGIMEDMNALLNKIEHRKEYVIGLIGTYDKKRDVIYHEIENNENATEIEKINIYNRLHSISLERRKVKEEFRVIATIENINFLETLKNKCRSVEKTVQKCEKKKEKIKVNVQNNVQSPSMIIKEIPYKTHKERIAIHTQMSKKYDKVTWDEDKKLVIGYNKVYET